MKTNTVLKTVGAFVFGLATYVQTAGGEDPNSYKARHPDIVFFAGAIGGGLAMLGFKAPGEDR